MTGCKGWAGVSATSTLQGVHQAWPTKCPVPTMALGGSTGDALRRRPRGWGSSPTGTSGKHGDGGEGCGQRTLHEAQASYRHRKTASSPGAARPSCVLDCPTTRGPRVSAESRPGEQQSGTASSGSALGGLHLTPPVALRVPGSPHASSRVRGSLALLISHFPNYTQKTPTPALNMATSRQPALGHPFHDSPGVLYGHALWGGGLRQ